jgi:NAD-dependent dihydropyrimidine dehydrogenase PreA subunit
VIKQLLNFASKTTSRPVEPSQGNSTGPVELSRRDVLRLGRSKPEPDGRWRMQMDADRCSDCAACVRICKTSALKRSQIDRFIVYAFDTRGCDGCGDCQRVCAEKALIVKCSDKNKVGISEIAHLPVALCSCCGQSCAAVIDGLCTVCRLNSMRIGENGRTMI